MNKDIAEKLRLIAAWHTPGGPTPDQPCPRKHEVCAEAAEEIERLREHAVILAATSEQVERERWSVLAAHVRCVEHAHRVGALETSNVRMMAQALDDVLGPNGANNRPAAVGGSG